MAPSKSLRWPRRAASSTAGGVGGNFGFPFVGQRSEGRGVMESGGLLRFGKISRVIKSKGGSVEADVRSHQSVCACWRFLGASPRPKPKQGKASKGGG